MLETNINAQSKGLNIRREDSGDSSFAIKTSPSPDCTAAAAAAADTQQLHTAIANQGKVSCQMTGCNRRLKKAYHKVSILIVPVTSTENMFPKCT